MGAATAAAPKADTSDSSPFSLVADDRGWPRYCGSSCSVNCSTVRLRSHLAYRLAWVRACSSASSRDSGAWSLASQLQGRAQAQLHSAGGDLLDLPRLGQLPVEDQRVDLPAIGPADFGHAVEVEEGEVVGQPLAELG